MKSNNLSTASFVSGVENITPLEPVNLCGYGQNAKHKKVHSKIEINAVFLNYYNVRLLIISADLLFVSNEYINILVDKLSSLGLKKENIFFAATHTHSAPSVDSSKPILGKIDTNYIKFFKKKLISLCDKMLEKNFEPCCLTLSKGFSEIAVNRRRRGLKFNFFSLKNEIIRAPNFLGPKDSSIYLIKLFDLKNKLRVILWCFASHPAEHYDKNTIRSDFMGFVREKTRKFLKDPNLPVIYLQGFSGNLIPYSKHQTLTIKKVLKHLLHGGKPIFQPINKKGFERISNQIWVDYFTAFKKNKIKKSKVCPEISTTTLPMSKYILSDKKTPSLMVYLVKLTNSIYIIGLSAEVVVEYINLINKKIKNKTSSTKTIIPVGCVGSVFGYLPTDQLIEEGGYESKDFFKPFNLTGFYKKKIQDDIVERISNFILKNIND